MEKADFLDRVATALAQRGMTDAEILRYTEKTSALLDKLPAEELGAVLSDRVDADRFAAELLAEEKPVKKPEPSPAAQRAALPVTKVPVPPAAQKPTVPAPQKAPTPAQQQTAPAGRPAQTPAAQRQTAPASAPQKTPAAPAGRPAQAPAPQRQTAPAPQKTPAAPAGRPAQAPAQKPSVPSAPAAPSAPARGAEQDARTGVSAKTEVVIDTGKVPSHPFSDRGKEKQKQQAAGGAVARDNRDYSRFWLLFWLTLPFTLILGLAGAAVFLGLIAILVLSIVGLTALLIAVSVAGTALALVGIIYGAIQLFSGSGPAGLYEIGEGLMIAGGTMLAGILLYNAAVRLAPFLIRKTARLIGVTAKALKKLFLKIKGAMAQ
ncbi:MAG: hypothetical protein II771_02010 [Clostridia bacterium]|nr:hypothetical protein [Clostridia bacterium]